MSNTRYQRLREQKRCTRCREQDERTLQGFSVCESCKRKFEAYRKEYLSRPGIAEQQRISSKNTVNRRYHQRQRNHQCVHCGATLADDYFYTNCPKCRQQKAEYYQKKKTASTADSDAGKTGVNQANASFAKLPRRGNDKKTAGAADSERSRQKSS